jgi:hypothetical protein
MIDNNDFTKLSCGCIVQQGTDFPVDVETRRQPFIVSYAGPFSKACPPYPVFRMVGVFVPYYRVF